MSRYLRIMATNDDTWPPSGSHIGGWRAAFCPGICALCRRWPPSGSITGLEGGLLSPKCGQYGDDHGAKGHVGRSKVADAGDRGVAASAFKSEGLRQRVSFQRAMREKGHPSHRSHLYAQRSIRVPWRPPDPTTSTIERRRSWSRGYHAELRAAATLVSYDLSCSPWMAGLSSMATWFTDQPSLRSA